MAPLTGPATNIDPFAAAAAAAAGGGRRGQQRPNYAELNGTRVPSAVSDARRASGSLGGRARCVG